jgi:hypothetical protein
MQGLDLVTYGSLKHYPIGYQLAKSNNVIIIFIFLSKFWFGGFDRSS